MIYNQPFIEIDGITYNISDISRAKAKGIVEGRSASGQYYKTVNRLEFARIPEITTIWLLESGANNLKNKLKERIIQVEGICISPYYYDLSLNPQSFFAVLLSEEVLENYLYRLTFELESVER